MHCMPPFFLISGLFINWRGSPSINRGTWVVFIKHLLICPKNLKIKYFGMERVVL